MSRIGVVGANGRLGQAICNAAVALGHEVVLRVHRGGAERLAAPVAIIDVSSAASCQETVDLCRAEGCGLVFGRSGRTARTEEMLAELSRERAVVVADNFAFGNHIMRSLCAMLADRLAGLTSGSPAECTIVDRHPPTKRDSPSQTAIALASLVQDYLGRAPTIRSLRYGSPVADHRMAATLSCESIEVVHRVKSLDAASRGALLAADWVIAQRGPVLAAMSDVYDAEGKA